MRSQRMMRFTMKRRDLNRIARGTHSFWMPPSGARAGDIVLVDLTMFMTVSGGAEILDRLWNNLATRT